MTMEKRRATMVVSLRWWLDIALCKAVALKILVPFQSFIKKDVTPGNNAVDEIVEDCNDDYRDEVHHKKVSNLNANSEERAH